MDDTRLYKYYRKPGYDLSSLVRECGSIRLLDRRGVGFFMSLPPFQIYQFLIADYNLRRFFNLNHYCGTVTFITFIFALTVAVCSIVVS